jgi:hypothetical protein
MRNIELNRLVVADVVRDGGSYGACFETSDGRLYSIWLQRSKMPDAEGPHHRWLFEYFGPARPQNCLPVITGSEDERALLDRLNDFMASLTANPITPAEGMSVIRLRELIHYIERREPAFPYDIKERFPG